MIIGNAWLFASLQRFAGFPKVTSAPNADKLDATASLAAKPPPIQTRSEFLSDSMMDSSALNDLQETDSGISRVF